MIGISFNVRISLRDEPDPYVTILGRPSVTEPLASPVVEYGLSLEALNQRVLTPFNTVQSIILDSRTVFSHLIERIEIRTVRTDPASPRLRTFFDVLLPFDYVGIDVSRELIPDEKPWGPKIGAAEKPATIPLDSLYDRMITSEPLRKASRKLFTDRHFARAVEDAFKSLNSAVKVKSGLLTSDNRELMQKAFSASNPVLRFNEGKSETDKNEQLGYMELFAGAMSGIRNPRAHEDALVDKPAAALEMLVLANHLMTKLEQAEIVSSQEKASP